MAGGTKKGGATPSVIEPDEIHDCSCPTMGVALAQIAWLGDVGWVFEPAPLVTLVAQLRLASSHFSCLTLPSKDLSCRDPTAEQREVMLLMGKRAPKTPLALGGQHPMGGFVQPSSTLGRTSCAQVSQILQ